ncbi:DKNYY domain-containing protein [Pedobacter sp. SL55]|uniref:DKNYY domain-containing protein n=1 Tax=Pedobacter sp. SL55 TaxID=2995161 RepID=UPI00227216F4|nr:DKNYY domain-containing protein [Pedobacter sp. SL55]WAC42576.1 hypothetical protein OVA16_09540 [Pedobacter sp. SL55]
MKSIRIVTSLLIIFAMENCNAQDTIPTKLTPPESLQIKINPAPFMDNGPLLDSSLQEPQFLVSGYAFYPKLKKIAYVKKFVHPMSSSGYGRLYYDEIKGIDYHSFEIINSDYAFAKDKNTYYLMGEPLNVQPNNQKIFIDNYYRNIRIVSANSTVLLRPGLNKVDKYIDYKPLGEVVYQKNDSLFLFDGQGMEYIKEPNFDAPSLKQIDWRLYQDHKNLYQTADNKIDKIENEQIVNQHYFKKVKYGTRGGDEGLTVFVGEKNFYRGYRGLMNYKLQNYHFIPNSNFYVYNSCLYFMNGSSFNAIGVSANSILDFNEFDEGLNDPKALRVNYTKTKVLSRDILVYADKLMFKEEDIISVDPKINIANLQYAGILPDALEKIIEKQFDKQYFFHNDLLKDDKDYYVIYRNSLTKVNKAKLSSFKWLNEFYYTYKGTLFGHEDFRYLNYNDPKLKLTDKTINFSKLKVFGMYFTDGIDIWYKSIKTDKTVNEVTIAQNYNTRAFSIRQTIKTFNLEIPNIAFSKLKEVENTEFITDGTYLLFRGNVIGKIDVKTLKVLANNYVEDATQYFLSIMPSAKRI